MDISYPVAWTKNALTDVCRNLVFIAIPTQRLINLHRTKWTKKEVSRYDLALQLHMLYLFRQSSFGEGPIPPCAPCHELIDVFSICPKYLEQILEHISQQRRNIMRQLTIQSSINQLDLNKEVEVTCKKRIPPLHMQSASSIAASAATTPLTVHTTIRDILPPPDFLRYLQHEHNSFNPYLLCNGKGYLKSNNKLDSLTNLHWSPEALKGDMYKRAQMSLIKELRQTAAPLGITASLINLQVRGFLNPNALPRPNISRSRKLFWGIHFSDFESTTNLMGTILSSVSVQYNMFVRRNQFKSPGDLRRVRIGHICKVFLHYSRTHDLLCQAVAKHQNKKIGSIKLRYNQLIANFRMYLREKFPKNWSTTH